MKANYDVIIVGGGPSGSSATMFLKKKGYSVLLLEKEHFPREKICGDGLSGKTLKVLRELNLINEIEKIEHMPMNGVIFSSPNGDILEVEPSKKPEDGKAAGYVVRRRFLDNLLFQNAKKAADDTIEGFTVTDLITENGQVVGVKGRNEKAENFEFRAKIVIGADGTSSIIASKVNAEKVEESHQCIAVRTYYENVEGMKDKIELHFIDEVLPGYFWIFPLPNKMANVGVGMLTKDQRGKRVDLKAAVDKAINSPMFKERFKNAKPIEPLKGWSLPLGSKRRKGYGNGYLLIGDAAALIDPFTGEGIGNALYSGMLASQVIDEAFKNNDFSSKTLQNYDALLHKELDEELQTMYQLQRLGTNKFLLNLAIKKAVKNKDIRDIIASTLVQESAMEYKHKLMSPMLWLKLLIS